MRLLIFISLFSLLPGVAVATPQLADSIVFGGRTYVLREVPLLGLWNFKERMGFRVGTGEVKPPEFDVRSTANWDGYEAQFEIRDSKLLLRQIVGYVEGKKRSNEEILIQKKFPLQVTWYTGRIHIAVGDNDDKTGEITAVLVFEVEKGVVKSISFKERMKPLYTWNGLPEVETDAEQDNHPEQR